MKIGIVEIVKTLDENYDIYLLVFVNSKLKLKLCILMVFIKEVFVYIFLVFRYENWMVFYCYFR